MWLHLVPALLGHLFRMGAIVVPRAPVPSAWRAVRAASPGSLSSGIVLRPSGSPALSVALAPQRSSHRAGGGSRRPPGRPAQNATHPCSSRRRIRKRELPTLRPLCSVVGTPTKQLSDPIGHRGVFQLCQGGSSALPRVECFLDSSLAQRLLASGPARLTSACGPPAERIAPCHTRRPHRGRHPHVAGGASRISWAGWSNRGLRQGWCHPLVVQSCPSQDHQPSNAV
ncbi:hypothetical protein J2S90_001676 [Arthrobacter bambusae]|uniref:Secreted protein n=1 Tax=Arthrobacter bambusae TaxID=1338426 RepID=A0AAW8D731_9MICC|nr:hypothetical protein [Arthrobacter bambusae]MDQ0129537.1 hypothetical protein [Arthrobacter bambusae]MDQ0180850.1 hypothetical protein [Arthrobacter bambusae]